MDLSLLGTLALGLAFVPYAVEVIFQVRLQADFLMALPPDERASLPPHPRHVWLAPAGSVRFFIALWRTVRSASPTDSPRVAHLKQRIRSSLRREIVWGTTGLLLLTYLLAIGWRPIWP